MASVFVLLCSILAALAVAAAASGYDQGHLQKPEPLTPSCKASELDAIRRQCKGAKELLMKRDECCKELSDRPERDRRGECVCDPVLRLVGAAEPLREACRRRNGEPVPCDGFAPMTNPTAGLVCSGDDGATVVKCRDAVRALPRLQETCLCDLAHRKDKPGGCFAEAVEELGIRPGDVGDVQWCTPRES